MKTFNHFIIFLIIFSFSTLSVNAQDSLNVHRLSRWVNTWDTARGIFVVDTIAYVAISSSGLLVLSIADTANPYEISRISFPGSANDVVVVGDFAYVANFDSAINIIDISNPLLPVQVGVYNTTSTVMDIMIQGNLAFVSELTEGLQILDITNIRNPSQIAFFFTGRCENVVVEGNYAYLACDWNGLVTIDISDPSNPTFVTQDILVAGQDTMLAYSVFVSENYAYISCGFDGFRILDISNPLEHTIVSEIDDVQSTIQCLVQDQIAYIADDYDLRIFDMTNPSIPVEIDSVHSPYRFFALAIRDNLLCSAEGQAIGLFDISIPSQTRLVHRYQQLHGNLYKIKLSGNYAFMSDNGQLMTIVDISNPVNPVDLNYRPSIPRYSRDIAPSGSYAYIVALSQMFVMNISDPNSPVQAGTCSLFENATSLTVQGNFAYAVTSGLGLRIINITDPANPTRLGLIRVQGENYYDIAVEDSLAYASISSGGLRIINISDSSNPVARGYYVSPTNGRSKSVAYQNGYAYLGSGDSLIVLNVSNSQNPVEVSTVVLANEGIIEDIVIEGNYAYIAENPGGMRVFDISNHAQPFEIGYYLESDSNNQALGVAVRANLAYVAGDNYYAIYDCSEALSVEKPHTVIPLKYSLSQNFPNPFNPTTEISFNLPRASNASLKVYNLMGQEIANLVNGNLSAGTHKFSFDGNGLASGVYLYQLSVAPPSVPPAEAGGMQTATKKMVLMK